MIPIEFLALYLAACRSLKGTARPLICLACGISCICLLLLCKLCEGLLGSEVEGLGGGNSVAANTIGLSTSTAIFSSDAVIGGVGIGGGVLIRRLGAGSA